MNKFLIGGTRFIVNIDLSDDGNKANDKIWLTFNSWRNLIKSSIKNIAVCITIPENVPDLVILLTYLIKFFSIFSIDGKLKI